MKLKNLAIQKQLVIILNNILKMKGIIEENGHIVVHCHLPLRVRFKRWYLVLLRYVDNTNVYELLSVFCNKRKIKI